jgi:hypothetical protein
MRRLVLLALAATTLLAGAAQADPAFDAFRNLCVANRGAAAPALAAADAAGWAQVPQQQMVQPGMQNANGRVLAMPGGAAAILITALQNVPQLGPSRMCMIGSVPAGGSDLAGQLAAFAGVPKQVTPDLPEGLYAWRDDNGRHVSIDQGTPDYRAQFTGGTALVATTRTLPQMTMIVLMSAAQ